MVFNYKGAISQYVKTVHTYVSLHYVKFSVMFLHHFCCLGNNLWFHVYGFSLNSMDGPTKITSGPENETIGIVKSHKHI